MSNLVSAKVHKKVFGSATRKAVMIYFSDKASDGGEGIWASKTTIAAELEMHRATVIRTINELVSEGILIVVGDRRHRNGATVEYDISMCAVDQLPDVELPRSESVPRTPKDDLTRRTTRPVAEGDPSHSATLPVALCNTMMSHSATQTILEPSKNHTGAMDVGIGPESLLAFQRFWEAHPKMGNRDRTLALWLAAEKSGADPQRIISEARRYRQINQGKDTRYLVSSDRWLEQRRWEGEPGKAFVSSDERMRGIEATAEMLAGKVRAGAPVVSSAFSQAILDCILGKRLLTVAQLQSVGVRV